MFYDLIASNEVAVRGVADETRCLCDEREIGVLSAVEVSWKAFLGAELKHWWLKFACL